MKLSRIAVSVLGVLIAVVGVGMAAEPAFAQALPVPPGPGLGDLLADPGTWLTKMFNAALLSLGNKATGDVVGFMDWLMGSGNVISQTPAALSYDSDTVKLFWGGMVKVGNAALAVVTLWGGVNMMVQPHMRAPYHGALELVPRVLLSGIMLNTSLDWGRFVVELNNELCRYIGGAPMPGWNDVQHQVPDGGPMLLNLIAMGIYLVMGLLLMGQMLMRLALVDVLLVIAPLAVLCWVLPQTYGWARLWFTTFFGTVFVQAIQVLVLRLGTDLIQRLPDLLRSMGSDPPDTGRIWLTTLLLGMAVLQLARKIPRLMPGMPSGAGVAYAGPNVVRQITSILSSSGNKKGGK